MTSEASRTQVVHHQPSGGDLTWRGVDHAALARRTRRAGWLQYAECRLRAERAFVWTAVVTAIGNPFLYLAAMGLGLGAIVQQDVGGVRYGTFVAPAMLVATIVTTAGNYGTWPIMSGFRWEKYYFSAAASPLSPRDLPLGETGMMTLRLVAQGLIFWGVSVAMGFVGLGSSWLSVPAATLAGLAMFAPLMAYTATLENEGLQLTFIQRIILMPMFLFAGTFFPLETMPIYLQWIGWVSPIWHGTQLARAASYGLAVPPAMIAAHLGFLTALTVVGLVVAARNYTRRLIA